jgi:hypothetical protein
VVHDVLDGRRVDVGRLQRGRMVLHVVQVVMEAYHHGEEDHGSVEGEVSLLMVEEEDEEACGVENLP